jgi:hypothetical protein
MFLAFFYIQTFFYTIMNLFITLLENVNKSRTSANNVSLMTEEWYTVLIIIMVHKKKVKTNYYVWLT